MPGRRVTDRARLTSAVTLRADGSLSLAFTTRCARGSLDRRTFAARSTTSSPISLARGLDPVQEPAQRSRDRSSSVVASLASTTTTPAVRPPAAALPASSSRRRTTASARSSGRLSVDSRASPSALSAHDEGPARLAWRRIAAHRLFFRSCACFAHALLAERAVKFGFTCAVTYRSAPSLSTFRPGHVYSSSAIKAR